MVKKEKAPEAKAKKIEASIEILEAKLADKKENPERTRKLRRGLRRLQRKLARKKEYTLDESLVRTEKLIENVNKQLDEVKGKGKGAIDPYYHSLSKKSKSLNKKLKQIKRKQEKIKKAEEKAAKKAAPKEEAKPEEKSSES